MIIIGGTYYEVCFEPNWNYIWGSGLRAVHLISEIDQFMHIQYYTCADRDVKSYLEYQKRLNPKLEINISDIFETLTFYYDHPLRTPFIYPRLDLYSETQININVVGGNILAFGLLEASISLKGDKVVYDPQSPVNPKSFTETGSTANKLIIIANLSEAKKMSDKQLLHEIKDYFFSQEKCFALIIKMGARGAFLFENKNDKGTVIPVYRTDKVWPIGSGDVFSSYFAYKWFKGGDIISCAYDASKAVAVYCNSMGISTYDSVETSFPFPELVINNPPSKKVYLAGPFFTFTERWLVNEIRNMLRNFDLKVFSPYHDVGLGDAETVVDKDIKGLNESDIIFAIIDGLDSGTLFEVGYAIAQKKKVIAFVQNEGKEALKMLEGTDCIIEKDLSSAIYKTYWYAI